jgi:hemoglobin
MNDSKAAVQTPYAEMGNSEELVRRLARRFYARMASDEPALAKLHQLDAEGKVAEVTQERFSLFLVEWLGGPALYSPEFGHPRLRMRHAHVPIDASMRDAWVRCMKHAMDDVGVTGDVRRFLDARFLEVADFLRNRP